MDSLTVPDEPLEGYRIRRFLKKNVKLLPIKAGLILRTWNIILQDIP